LIVVLLTKFLAGSDEEQRLLLRRRRRTPASPRPLGQPLRGALGRTIGHDHLHERHDFLRLRAMRALGAEGGGRRPKEETWHSATHVSHRCRRTCLEFVNRVVSLYSVVNFSAHCSTFSSMSCCMESFVMPPGRSSLSFALSFIPCLLNLSNRV